MEDSEPEKSQPEKRKFKKKRAETTIGYDDETDLEETVVAEYKPLDLVTRDQWGAAPAGPCELLLLPVENILVSYTGSDPCYDDETCARAVRDLQSQHMEKGLPDIMYNFLIAGNGRVYEGRGWEKNASKAEEHDYLDYKSIDMMYIGRYKSDLTEEQKRQLNEIIYHGLENKYIEDPQLDGDTDVQYIEYKDYHNWNQCYDPYA